MGDDSLTNTQNTEIFKTVQIYLSECGHFSKNVKIHKCDIIYVAECLFMFIHVY